MVYSKGKIAIILIGIVLAGYFGHDYYYMQTEKKNVAQILRQKYGQEFNIQSCEYFHSEGFVGRKGIQTFVISNDQPPVAFFVSRFIDSPWDDLRSYFETPTQKDGKIYAGYLEQLWSREATAKIQGVAESVFQYSILVEAGIGSSYSFRTQLRGHTPTFSETLETHSEVFANTAQSIWVLSFYAINESNKSQEAERIFRFMSEMRKLGIPKFLLHINYYVPSYLAEAKNSIEKAGGVISFASTEIGTWAPKAFPSSGKRWQFEMVLLEKDVEKINSPSDIVPLFKAKIR